MPAIVLDDHIDGTGLPSVTFTTPAQIREYESTSYAHWIFDQGGAGNLTDRKGGKLLTAVGSGFVTHNAASMSLTGASGTGYASDLADLHDVAIAMVVKYPSASAKIAGSYNSTQGFDMQLGFGASIEYQSNFRGTTPANLSMNTIITPTVGDWLFVAQSISLSGSGNSVRQLVAGYGSADNTSLTGTRTLATTNNVSLGEPYLAAANGAFEVAEFMLWNSHQTLAFLNQVYVRSKDRMARRSITVV